MKQVVCKKAPPCRRHHPAWLTHTELQEVISLIDEKLEDGSYYGPKGQYVNRLHRCKDALFAADWNCCDENERPKR